MAVENDGVVKIEKVHTFAQTHGCFRWSEILRKTTSPVGRPTDVDWICLTALSNVISEMC